VLTTEHDIRLSAWTAVTILDKTDASYYLDLVCHLYYLYNKQ